MSPLSSGPDEPGQSDKEPANRRGRRLSPIRQDAGIAHRAWLEPVRDRLLDTGLTLEELANRANYSKSRISELLGGQGKYPRWQFTHSVAQALGLPTWPLRRLWAQAAREADKKTEWITRCVDLGPVLHKDQPVDHQGFTGSMHKPYKRFARVFLQSNQRADIVVAETFDILWLCWEQALLSDNVPRYAWTLLRNRVFVRAAYHDGHPDLRAAAFATVAQHRAADPVARQAQLDDSIELFDAIGRLPHNPLDVVVLHHLLGMPQDRISAVLGITPAAVHTSWHHARFILRGDDPIPPTATWE